MNLNKEVSTQEQRLVDIRSVSVDKSMSKEERMEEFIRQIGNLGYFPSVAHLISFTIRTAS